MKHYMNSTFKISTTTIGKLPLNWEEQRRFMAYHVTYITKAYKIAPSLVVNNDQTAIYNKTIVISISDFYRHYAKNIATKQPKTSNVCGRWVGSHL